MYFYLVEIAVLEHELFSVSEETFLRMVDCQKDSELVTLCPFRSFIRTTHAALTEKASAVCL